MKTKLPIHIHTKAQARKFLSQLFANDEAYHPEDDANDIINLDHKNVFTPAEARSLNILMDEIYTIRGFDPCDYILKMHISHNKK